MGLPWARLDTNIAHHDKIVWLKHQRGGWRAITAYTFSIAWAVGHGTDAHIPTHMATELSADKTTISLLLACHLWEPVENGWHIRNFAERQELEIITENKRASARLAAAKGNCIRWHGPDCRCWKTHTEPTSGSDRTRDSGSDPKPDSGNESRY